MVDVMKRAASQVDASFPDQPEVRAELHGTIGGVFDHLGMMNEAQEEIRKVLALARASLGEDAPETLNTRVWLGRMYFESRQYEKAIEEFSGALDRARRALGPANIVTAESMHLLGNVYNLSGRQREAEPLLLEALRLEEAIGPGDFLTGTVHMSTATLYMYSQRYDQAEHHWRRALEILRGTVGEIHWLTLRSEEELASVYTREGRLDLAEPLARHSLETSRRELGEHHTQTDISAGMVAELEVERGNFTEAERIMREQVARHRTMDMGDRILPFTLRRLAYVLARGGRDDAVEVGREALAQTIAQFGERHFTVAGAWRTLAFALFKREHPDFERSEEASRKAADLYRALFGDLHPYLAGTLQDEGRMEHARGRHEQAAALFAQALRIYDDLGLDAHWATSELKSDLGGCLAETGRTTEAQQLLDEAWTFLHERRGDADRVTVENVRRRIALYEATGRPDEAARLRANLPG